jgi:hypothetical protein
MKRILTIVSVLSMVMASGAMAENYGWSLSASSTDPAVNTAAPGGPSSIQTVYVWLSCVDPLGAAAAEFALQTTGFAFAAGPATTYNGVLATGSPDLLLAIPCATAQTLCLSQGYFDVVGAGGTACLVASAGNSQINVTVDCRQVGAQEWPNAITGFASNGTTPCTVGLCTTTAVEDASWGSIKGLYR